MALIEESHVLSLGHFKHWGNDSVVEIDTLFTPGINPGNSVWQSLFIFQTDSGIVNKLVCGADLVGELKRRHLHVFEREIHLHRSALSKDLLNILKESLSWNTEIETMALKPSCGIFLLQVDINCLSLKVIPLYKVDEVNPSWGVVYIEELLMLLFEELNQELFQDFYWDRNL